MPTAATKSFQPETLRFLQELEKNNNREWFQANKASYEKQVLDVALRFIQSMQEPLADVSPHFTAMPKRVGGSLMRIYRDTRFGRDKTPYKTNLGIQFRHELGKDVHAPGYYLHLDPREAFIGVGLWRPPSDALKAIRERITARPAEWEQARDDRRFAQRFRLAGEQLKRPPRGYKAEHPQIDDLKRKDFIAVQSLTHEDFLKAGFRRQVTASFQAAEPFMRFLCRAVNVPY